jgi:hypothetical protein
MAQDRFYGNFNPAVCVSLPRGQLIDSDIASIARAIKKALKEQLKPEFIAMKIKTMESIDCRRFLPDTHCQFTSWPKELMRGEDLNFGFKFIGDGDEVSAPHSPYPPKRKPRVVVSAGDELPFHIGTMQCIVQDEDVYKIIVAVPRGMRDAMLDQVRGWSFEKPKVIFQPAPQNVLWSETQARL